MSTDTAKDNASVVDSSVTQKLDVGHLEDAEDSSCRAADEHGQLPNGKRQLQREDSVKNTSAVEKAKNITRYYIIKSLNHNNIQMSVQKGIWATQVMNEPILDEAFHNSDKVILIFSVNMSGFFQGYAQMMSSVGWRRDDVWNQGTGGSNPWGRSFKVKWLRLNNLPFHKTLHLKNPLNDYKPVKISRDCQELSPDIGESLCELIDKEIDDGEKGVRDDTHLRWHGMEPACSLQNEDYNFHPTNTTGMGGRSMLYPDMLQQQIAEASRSHASYQGSVGVFYPGCVPFLTSKPAHSSYSLPRQKVAKAEDPQVFSQLDAWDLPGDAGPFYNNTISEDEFLEMSYEEYLEAHSGSNKRRSNPVTSCFDSQATKPSRGKQTNKEDEDNVSSLSDHKHSRKRSRH